MSNWRTSDTDALFEAYFATVGALYEKTRCDIVAHFDLITKFNEDGKLFDTSHPRYQAAVHAALDRLCETPARFEINTGAMSRGYRTAPYPEADIIAEIQRKGQQFVFSSDCHARENLLFGWEQCSKLYSFLNDVRLGK